MILTELPEKELWVCLREPLTVTEKYNFLTYSGSLLRFASRRWPSSPSWDSSISSWSPTLQSESFLLPFACSLRNPPQTLCLPSPRPYSFLVQFTCATNKRILVHTCLLATTWLMSWKGYVILERRTCLPPKTRPEISVFFHSVSFFALRVSSSF